MAGAKKRAKKPVGRDRVLFNILSYAVLTALSAACLLPFLLVLSGSVSEQYSIQLHGYRLFPETISLDAYKMLFRIPQELLRAYGVTIFVTAVGTVLGLWLTSMAAYVLSSRDFRFRYQVSFFFYFTTLFSGGVIPTYILIVNYLNLKDNLLALILPGMLTPWFIMLMRNFIKSIPFTIIEAAKIDGAGDWRIYMHIVLPLSKAGLATIGLFIALNYWNDWYHASLYINSEALYPLQYLLYRMLSNAEYMKQAAAAGVFLEGASMPTETLKMATAIVVTGPILLLYPFIQRYFVKGIMIGGVKG